MKQHIFPAIKLTIVSIVLFMGIYTGIVWAVAQLSNNKGNADTITINDKKYYTNIGQSFTEDKYFNSRPSAVNYNAAGSGGSNKGPSNPDYLQQVQARIDTFLVHNPSIKKVDISSELVTASGSGLDPNISLKAAYIQAKRIATVRNISIEKVNQLIQQHTEKPLLGLFGTEKINVLTLNLALDRLK
jgi:K+-transporting ATPase ATPase C chain